MKRSVLLLTVAFLISVGGIASAQTDISASVNDNFAPSASGKGLDEKVTKSAGFLFSYRHFSNSHSGVEVNYGFTKNSHILTNQSGVNLSDVQANVHELSVDYVFHATIGPIQPFLLAGGGLLMFHPISNAKDQADPYISSKKRPAFLYGAGVDVRMTKKLSLRGQYRALVYEAPDYYGDQYALHTSAAIQAIEPSVGIVYKF